jgi:23S rRNA pseudoU1915 N3-methylase RlmH
VKRKREREKERKRERESERVSERIQINCYVVLLVLGYLRPIKHGLVLLFAVCFAILTYFYKHERGALGNNIGFLLKIVLGEEDKPDILERFISTFYKRLKNTLASHFTSLSKTNTSQNISQSNENSITRT